MNLSSPFQQLILPVQQCCQNAFDNFYGESNLKNMSLLKSALTAQTETLIFISGAKGAGKTHLLHAALLFAEEQSRASCYFSMSDFDSQMKESENMEQFFSVLNEYSFVILDDIDALFPEKKAMLPSEQKAKIAIIEESMFNLFNKFKLQGKQLLFSARKTPSQLNLELPDLKSRLQSGLLLNLKTLDDLQKQNLLKTIAKDKGFSLDDDVNAFILKRSGRDLGTLLSLLNTLDKASLTEQRKLTIPFVKKILHW